MRRAALLLAIATAGCDRGLAHTVTAFQYEADAGSDAGCLTAPVVVDVVDGPAPTAPCPEVRCWISPDGTVYVGSATCDVPPGLADHTGDAEGPCVKALAIYAPDGGSVRCPAPPDGGT